MRRIAIVPILAVLFATGGQLQAQDGTELSMDGELRAMVASPAPVDEDRQVLLAFLDSASVADTAASYGVDMERIKAGVATLDAATAETLAGHVRDADEQEQVGGDTIVISSTAIIIALLALILIQM